MEKTMCKRYVFFSDDVDLKDKLRPFFSPKEITFRPVTDFQEMEDEFQLFVLDGDALPPETRGNALKKLKQKNIPVVYIFKTLTGREAMDLLKEGVISVLFKDYPAERIKKELKDILYNFNYLEKVKELADNDAKTKKFLGVINTLTSDNDIGNIMVTILNSMKEVFKLESIVFFVAARGKLKQKILLGKAENKPPESEWELKNTKIGWLKTIQKTKRPIYITGDSKKSYKKYFKENTVLLPLVIKDKFLGLIAAAFKDSSGEPSKREISLLSAFAEQTSVALENAQLYRDIIQTREELIAREKKSLLGQIVLSLNHEINNPLSIISMEAQLIQRRMVHKEEKVDERLANIENNIDRIKSILETISSLNIDGQITQEYISGREMLQLFNEH